MKCLLLISIFFIRASVFLGHKKLRAFSFQNHNFGTLKPVNGRNAALALSSFQPFRRWKKDRHNEDEALVEEPPNSSTFLGNEIDLVSQNNSPHEETKAPNSSIFGNVNDPIYLKDRDALSPNVDALRATIGRVPGMEDYIIDFDAMLKRFFAENNQTLPASVTNAVRKQMEEFLNNVSTAFTLDSIRNDFSRDETTPLVAFQDTAKNEPSSSYSIVRDDSSFSLLEDPSEKGTYPIPYSIPYLTDLVAFFSKFLFASGYLPLLSSSVANTSITSFFNGFDFTEIQPSDAVYSIKASEMARLSGDIYEDTQLFGTLNELGHTVVVNDTSADVAWLITDSIDLTSGKPIMVRTVTIRGYSAVDTRIDRIRLLQKICTASPVPIGSSNVVAHSGLLEVAKEIYKDITPYIMGLGKHHKLILNGHSIGGSISVLMLFLLATEHGADFVQEQVKHVYTFGSPPVVAHARPDSKFKILDSFGLPDDVIKGYAQPWDPIIRLFSHIDPLYPLVDDIGEDGKTLWINGPPRTLRPLTKAIFESWKDWPEIRDLCRSRIRQNFTHVGRSHLFLPEPMRYLTDRMVSLNIAAPPIKSIIQLRSSQDMLPLLNRAFPLDVFGISYVSTAIRSFFASFPSILYFSFPSIPRNS